MQHACLCRSCPLSRLAQVVLVQELGLQQGGQLGVGPSQLRNLGLHGDLARQQIGRAEEHRAATLVQARTRRDAHVLRCLLLPQLRRGRKGEGRGEQQPLSAGVKERGA